MTGCRIVLDVRRRDDEDEKHFSVRVAMLLTFLPEGSVDAIEIEPIQE